MNKNNKKKNKLTKKEMLKENINKLLPGIILIFVSSFMFFIYEPLLMYATNINDFWFDFRLLFSSNIIIFLLFFLFVLLIYIGIFFINKKFFKNNKLLNIVTLILYLLLYVFYIEGNFLAIFLPNLDGSVIVWDSLIIESILSIIVIVTILGVIIISIKKKKVDKFFKYSHYFTIIVFGSSLFSLMLTYAFTEDVFMKKSYAYSTINNFEKMSTVENFIILVMDSVDSKDFSKILTDKNLSHIFEDFTYYPDTLSAYPFTRNSIPFIISGLWNHNETTFIEYSSNAYSNSKLLDSLYNNNYDLNMYQDTLYWNKNDKIKRISNIDFTKGYNMINMFLQEFRYVLFKYLPYPLKRITNIENLNFNSVRINNDKEKQYLYYNWYVYDLFKNLNIDLVEKKQFKFIHVEGAHHPFNYDGNVNFIENGTYQQKINASIKIVETYLNKLKENEVYDNSNIIIMADHGFDQQNYINKRNPILLIKGINEKHEMNESDLPISFEDLNDVYLDLLNGKKNDELFQNIEKNRERKFIFYKYAKESEMIEYVQKGKAWDNSTLKETGKVYKK